MHLPPFTIEIHPRAWYALANLPKEAYARIQAGLAAVAENAAHAAADGAGHFLSLDGYLARYEVQAQRRCVTVLGVERAPHAGLGELQPAPARNVLDVPQAHAAPPAAAGASPAPADEPPRAAAPELGDC